MKIKKAVIAAGGFGTRMLPAAKSVPKEMLPLLDRPVIQYIVEEVVASGIKDILIITNRGKAAMEDYFDYSPELQERLETSGKTELLNSVRRAAEMANIYFIRQKETNGFGHSILQAKGFAGGEPFAILSGDDVIMSDKPVTKQLIDAAEKYGASALGVQRVAMDAISKYSSIKASELEDRIYKVTDMNEKPKPEEAFSDMAILGRYIVTSEIFEILEKTPPGHGGEIQLTDGLRELCRVSPMVAVNFEGRRYDTGNLPGFLEATIDFALKNDSVNQWLMEFMAKKVSR